MTNQSNKLYSVTRIFTDGDLAGVEFNELSRTCPPVGFKATEPDAGGSYVITDCREVGEA